MSSSAGRVPIRLGDFSVMDSEFDNIRERFDAEMKKMEDEMNKFRSEVLDKDALFTQKKHSTSRSVSSTTSTSTSRRVTENGKDVINEKSSFASSSGESRDLLSDSGMGSHSHWLQGLSSPLIKEADKGQKELKLRFDVSEYTPEEIMVKTVDNKLLVHAKHEEKGEGKSVYREYNREFLLPSGTDPETIRSSLSKDGILTVEAPLPQAAIEKK